MTADVAIPALVDCPPLTARLTEASCIRRWRRAQEKLPAPWDSLHHCRTCPIGALRAGAPAAVATNAAIAIVTAHFCPRCERPASRLINGRLCVSCYNRTREAVIGRNAKGTPPKKLRVLTAEMVVIAPPPAPGACAVPVRTTVEHAKDHPEALVIAARMAGPGAIIAIPPLRLPVAEAA